MKPSVCSTASSWRPAPGSDRCCRLASTATTPRCSTRSVWPATWRGRGSRRRRTDLPDAPRLAPATPIALFLREHAESWLALRSTEDIRGRLSEAALALLAVLHTRGASFFADLRHAGAADEDGTRTAVGSLVAAGLAASDGFAGLRALLRAATDRPGAPDRRANFSGRWSAVRATELSREMAVERHAWTLLRRYGVMFRRLTSRETPAVPWRDLARVYRRLEARGEIRGGRFVTGMSGEQFALPRAVERLREVRRTPADGRVIAIGTADPLNLAGIVTTGDRVRAAARNRIAYRDGVPLAVREGDFVRPLAPIDPAVAPDVSRALARRRRSLLSSVVH